MNELSANLLPTLLRTTVFLSIAALIVHVVLGRLRPHSPMLHRLAWVLVLVQGCFLFRLPLIIPYQQPVVEQVEAPSSKEPPTGSVQNPFSRLSETLKQLLPMQFARPESSGISRAEVNKPLPAVRTVYKAETEAFHIEWPVVFFGGWIAGMVLLPIFWIVCYQRFLHGLRQTSEIDVESSREWQELLAGHRIDTAIPLRAAQNIGPLLCRAWGGYMLVVPAELWPRLAPAERMSILRHELAHFQRSDLVKSLVVRLLALPQWFNPLAALAVRRFDEAAEWACDQAAKGPDAQGCRVYAKALLQLNEALGMRMPYRAAASGRGLSVRIYRLLTPQVKEDSIMKKTLILGTALGLALVCLVRLDLVAKEPAEKKPATSSAEKQPGDVLRYMPNDCRMICRLDVAGLRKTNPEGLKKVLGPRFGLKVEDIDYITVGSPLWPLPEKKSIDSFSDIPKSVATIVVPQSMSALKSREHVEKNLGKSPWKEETIGSMTLYVQQSKEPVAFFQPTERTLVIGPAKLVREVLQRAAPVQLPEKMAKAWAASATPHAIRVIVAPPPPGDPMRAFWPDDLYNGMGAVQFHADMVEGKQVRFCLSVPCTENRIAYQVRGLCAMFLQCGSIEHPAIADAMKSIQLAVSDRRFELIGTLPAAFFDGPTKLVNMPVNLSPVQFIPDEIRNGVKSVQFEANMATGEDFCFRLSIPCVDAGIANEVCGLCGMFSKVIYSQVTAQLPSANDVVKSFQFAVNDRCFVWQGKVPASSFQGNNEVKTTYRSLLPDDVWNGVKGILIKADMEVGKDMQFRVSIPCVDAGVAYQVRGICATFSKPFLSALVDQKSPGADVVKSFQYVVEDRSFVIQGAVPASLIKTMGSYQTANSNAKTKAVTLLQGLIYDIQPDGSIRNTSTIEVENSLAMEMKNHQFYTSDFDKIEKITNDKGRPIHFTAHHDKKKHIYTYSLTFNDPIPPGKRATIHCESTITTLVQPTGKAGEFRYHMTHSPNAPFTVRRVEIHRLPPGAELLEQNPNGSIKASKDGRIELRVAQTIMPGQSMDVAFRYRLGEKTK
jgi:beta-lactamase regulating signal transducer with metallopeptidase domain